MAIFTISLEGALGVGSDFNSTMQALSPFSWWKLGDDTSQTTAADQQGANDGDYINESDVVTTFTPVTGHPHAASLIAGSTDESFDQSGEWGVRVPDSVSFDGLTAFSWFARINKGSITDQHRVLVKELAGNNIIDARFVSDGEFRVVLQTTDSSSVVLNHPPGLADGANHSVGISYDGATFRLYVDGVESVSAALTGTVLTNDAPFMIGRTAGSPLRNFIGKIDEVALFNTSLTATNHSDLHSDAETAGGEPMTGGLSKKAELSGGTLAGAIGPTGVIQKKALKILGGVISSSSTLTKKVSMFVEGAMSGATILIGNLSKSVFMSAVKLTGSILPSGTIIKKPMHSLTGAVSFAGSVTLQLAFTIFNKALEIIPNVFFRTPRGRGRLD